MHPWSNITVAQTKGKFWFFSLITWFGGSVLQGQPGTQTLSTLWLCVLWITALPPLYHLQWLTILSRSDTGFMISFHKDHSGESDLCEITW